MKTIRNLILFMLFTQTALALGTNYGSYAGSGSVGSDNTNVSYGTGYKNNENNNTSIGRYAGMNNKGNSNLFFGSDVGNQSIV